MIIKPTTASHTETTITRMIKVNLKKKINVNIKIINIDDSNMITTSNIFFLINVDKKKVKTKYNRIFIFLRSA